MRICCYLLDLSRNPPDGVSVGLGDDDNIFKWELMIVGPPDTLYEGGFFQALLEFPPDFPNAPPVMTFKTPMWHPNGAFAFAYTHCDV
jgi:ubiquitin-conjugating enzyme E2 G1